MHRSITISKVRLFVEASLSNGATLEVSAGQLHYLINVMRCKLGDKIRLFNGCDGEWWSHVEVISQKSVRLIIDEQVRVQDAGSDVWLVFAPIRRARLGYLIEKTTELGVAEYRPIMTEYSSVKSINISRLRAITIEAAEQSDRLTVPNIQDTVELKALLSDWPSGRQILFCDESGQAESVLDALKDQSQRPVSCAVLVGPEGGFSPDERDRMSALPFVNPISLGKRLLRAETAAIAALTLWQAHLGEWQS